MYEAIRPSETLCRGSCACIGTRVSSPIPGQVEDETTWTDENINVTALEHFPSTNRNEALSRPILFSNWTSKNYVSVDRDVLETISKLVLRCSHEEEFGIQWASSSRMCLAMCYVSTVCSYRFKGICC